MNVLERDFPTHGVFFKYTDIGIKLGFVCDAYDLLEEAYQETGTETYYQYFVEEAESENTTFTEIFRGDIDFETRKLETEFFNAEINVIDTLSKIKNRRKLETNLNRGRTHDGESVSNINYEKVALLATKRYEQLLLTNNGDTISETSVVDTNESIIFAQIGFDQLESIEIIKYTPVVTKFTPAQEDSFLTLANDTSIKFSVEYDFDITLTETQGSGTTQFLWYFYILPDRFPESGNAPFYIIESNLSSGASPQSYAGTFYGFKDAGDFGPFAGKFSADTKWYFGFQIEMTSTGNTQFDADIDIRYMRVNGTDVGAKIGTVSRTYHLHDALNKTLTFMTGEYDFLYSELLGDEVRGYASNGCLSTMRLTNGYNIRQILDNDKAPEFSFDEFVKNIDSPAAIGYGIEELSSPTRLIDSTGVDKYSIEWRSETATEYFIRIFNVNLTAEITIGDKLTFHNSGVIYGTYEVTGVGTGILPARTDVDLLKNSQEAFIPLGSTDIDVVIFTDATTEVRERMRLEKWEHFYGDEELIDLGDVEEYIEEPFDDILYNKFDLGFKKYANDEDKPTTLEDFETKSSWGLPLKRSDKILSRVMTWVMSTFMLNESRDTIFNEKPTTSHKLDNDIFLFDIDDLRINATCQFVHNVSSDDEVIVPDYVYENYIREEGIFNVSAVTTPSNSGNYQFYPDRVLHNVGENTYTIPVWQVVTNANELVGIRGFISEEDGGTYEGKTYYDGNKAEADEKLTSSTNISGPRYTYNQRRTQKRFLIRWGRFINSVLGYLSDVTQTIQNLFYFNNGDFTTQLGTFALSQECLFGAPDEEIREADDITTDVFPQAKFKPNIISCTVKICDADYDTIVNAHKNALTGGSATKNYGYMSITTPKDESKKIWLLSMKRSPVDRIAKIRGIERNTIAISAYNFTGIEKVTVTGIPDFERTSTFRYKGTITLTESGNNQILFDNLATNNKGLQVTVNFSDKLEFRLQNTSVGFNTLLVSTTNALSIDTETEVEVLYDGSSSASGVTLKVGGVSVATTVGFDQLTATTLTGSNGYAFGVQKNNAVVRGSFILKDMLIEIDSIEQFSGQCVNNGDDTYPDTSGQDNNGAIDRSTSTVEEFYITL
jgi:hypothetical protein